jgi:predicted ArsR family transcriptional regulator
MKTTVSQYDFERAFADADREDQFSYEGLKALFDYLEDYEEQTGEEIELDVIALCCDYSEDTVKAIAANYSIDLTDCDDEEEQAETVREYLEDNGAFVGEVTGGFVYRAF